MNELQPHVSSGVFLPYGLVPMGVLKRVTARYKNMGSDETIEVKGYAEVDGGILLPRHFGLQLIAQLGIEIESAISGGRRVKFPKNVVHVGEYEYQDRFVASILAACDERNDFLVRAHTGAGKTVCALSVIQKRGVAALIVVDQDNLRLQWEEKCKSVLGLSDRQIGVVQGPVCRYRGASVTVAMVQTLVSREFPKEFYEYFGTVVFDEVHTAGAPTFSRSLLMFPAEVRFGMSATVDRKDSLQKLLEWNLGEVAVALDKKHEVSRVYYLESDTVYSWYANVSSKTGRMLQEVSMDSKRNALIVRAIHWLYAAKNRDILVVSDRIEQLEALMVLCAIEGIPTGDMGLYCGFFTEWKWTKNPTPKRRPPHHEQGTDYTPVAFLPNRKRISRVELEKIKAEKQVLFATFGMFTKGVDVPRLSAGIDCTPRSRAQQVHGRILRAVEGKPTPIWVTIRDIMSYRLEHQFVNRLLEYQASSAEIYEWNLEKGVRKRDAADLQKEARLRKSSLQSANIRVGRDGRNIVVMPGSPGHREPPPSATTGRSTR